MTVSVVARCSTAFAQPLTPVAMDCFASLAMTVKPIPSRRVGGLVLGAASGGGLEADVAVDRDDEDGLAAGLAEIELKLGVELLRQRVDDAQAAAGPHVRRRGRPVVGDAAFDEFSRRPALDPDRA